MKAGSVVGIFEDREGMPLLVALRDKHEICIVDREGVLRSAYRVADAGLRVLDVGQVQEKAYVLAEERRGNSAQVVVLRYMGGKLEVRDRVDLPKTWRGAMRGRLALMHRAFAVWALSWAAIFTLGGSRVWEHAVGGRQGAQGCRLGMLVGEEGLLWWTNCSGSCEMTAMRWLSTGTAVVEGRQRLACREDPVAFLENKTAWIVEMAEWVGTDVSRRVHGAPCVRAAFVWRPWSCKSNKSAFAVGIPEGVAVGNWNPVRAVTTAHGTELLTCSSRAVGGELEGVGFSLLRYRVEWTNGESDVGSPDSVWICHDEY